MIKMKRIIRFTASWCQPCKSLALNLEKAELYNTPIEVVDVDLYPEVAKEYGIRSIPALVMLHENIEMRRIVGLKTPKELKDWFKQE